MLLGNPPANNTDVAEHWLKFIETMDARTCLFVNHPMNRYKKEELEDYKKKYDYLTALEKKIGGENMYICNEDDNTHIKTMWAHISIVFAEIMMMQESIMKFGLCKKYILISLSCCPLYNYNVIHDTVCQDEKSWISIMSTWPFVTKTLTNFYKMREQEHLDKTSGIFNYYAGLKISQWMILSEKHVRYLYSLSTLEQKDRTYLYDTDIVCNEGTVTSIKYNNILPHTSCEKDNCLDEIRAFISTTESIIKSQLPNCGLSPYDEYAIQQFVLNKILNNADKDKYLTNKEELLKILQNEFRIMRFEDIKANIESNYSKLNHLIPDVELDFYYNEPSKNTLYPDCTENKILLNEYNSILPRLNKLVKDKKMNVFNARTNINTYNTVYFGRKFAVYPCRSIRFPEYDTFLQKQNCDKIVFDDYVFIGSTYTNWLLVTNNLSNYSRSIIFKEYLSEKEIDARILKKLLSYKNKKPLFDQYLTYIKKNSPQYYEKYMYSCVKNAYNSNVDLPEDFDKIIQKVKHKNSNVTPPIPPSPEVAKDYHLNETMNFDMMHRLNPLYLLTEEEISNIHSVLDYFLKIVKASKRHGCRLDLSFLFEAMEDTIFRQLTSPGIKISYHPSEYYTTVNEPNMFFNVSNYLKNKLHLFVMHTSTVRQNEYYKKFSSFVEEYKLPSLLTEKYGNPLDKYTLIPVILSGSLFVRKCVNGCSINKFTDNLFAMDYIYKDYAFEHLTEPIIKHSANLTLGVDKIFDEDEYYSKVMDEDVDSEMRREADKNNKYVNYFNKYLKYKNKYLKLKKET
jgi:hypothetical protein